MATDPAKLFIDYAEHPGFKNYSDGSVRRGMDGLDIFRRLDAELSDFTQDKRHRGPEEIAAFLKDVVSPNTAKLADLIRDEMGERDLYRPVALKSVQSFFEVLRDEIVFRNEGKTFKKTKGRGSNHEEMATDLESKGFFVKRLDEGRVLEFWDSIKDFRTKLEERRATRPVGMASCTISLPQEGKCWKIFRSLVEDSGIHAAVNNASRCELDLDYYALQLSHPDEQWWKDCYDDVGLPTSKNAYMHFDQDFALVKAILYLQPVGLENGPFSIVPQNAVFPASYSREVFVKRLDQNTFSLYSAGEPEKVFPYYRTQFKLPQFRESFLKLPAVIRSTSHFGDDLVEGSEISDFLLKNEIRITSEIGNCTVFTGGRTIHRGGMVEKGERWAIQIGFRLADRSWSSAKQRFKRDVISAVPTPLMRGYRKIKSFLKK